MSILATNKQVPDNSILDLNGRQVYLGNTYSGTAAFSVGNTETNILLLRNPASTASLPQLALFQNLLKVVENTAAHSVILNVYLNPTVAAGAQTIALAADVAGSLNSTYFTLFDEQGNGYYVWFNINSAGVDPAVAGKTGIQVAGATGATAATLGAAAKPLIAAANSGKSFSVAGTSTLTVTNLIKGPFTPAADGTAATSFVFTVTAGAGTPITPVNLRSAYANSSTAQISASPISSASGTLIDSMSVAALSVSESKLLKILDAGQSLLITANASAATTSINAIIQWYEL